jgi:hypothetical protein
VRFDPWVERDENNDECTDPGGAAESEKQRNKKQDARYREDTKWKIFKTKRIPP